MKAMTFICAGLLAAPIAFAKPKVPSSSLVNYDYVTVQFVSENIDQYDCTQTGLALKGSYEFEHDIFAVASLADVSGDGCGSTTFSAGAGYKVQLNESYDAYASLSYANTSVDVGQGDSGLVLAGGVRGFVVPKLEAKVELAHQTAFSGNTSLNGGVAYHLQDAFYALADIVLGSESSGLSLGVRIDF
ncbi:hypothetical protein [Agaribacterium haliotis]|uniref:hypothetical protein n=1 Tax=Agaribacterium haliotis TaxID=2013869 RepID=UPI0011784B83|nr:hypothetical protein [Agaribacterium haliotis]